MNDIKKPKSLGARGSSISQKLTDDDVRAIRANVNGETHQQTADRYGVSRSAIVAIRNYTSWTHVA